MHASQCVYLHIIKFWAVDLISNHQIKAITKFPSIHIASTGERAFTLSFACMCGNFVVKILFFPGIVTAVIVVCSTVLIATIFFLITRMVFFILLDRK